MIQICSRHQIAQIVHNPRMWNLIIISINDTEAFNTGKPDTTKPPFNIDSNNIKDILVLNFDDVESETEYLPAKLMSDDDGIKLLNFLVKHQKVALSKTETIFIHCKGGVSRSAAVAAAFSMLLPNQDDWWIFNDPQYAPNRHVYETLLKLANLEIPQQSIDLKFEKNQILANIQTMK